MEKDHADPECPEQLLVPALTLSEVADDASGAVEFLSRTGNTLRWLSRATVFYRLQLGRQLIVMQQRELWTKVERPVGDGQSGIAGTYRTFDDFMARGFPQITGLGRQSGYAAVMLARSAVLQRLPELELRK